MDDPGLPARRTVQGPTGKNFVRFGVGLVQLDDVIRVEGRLTENDPAKLQFGQEVELTMVPFTPPTRTATRSSRSRSSPSESRGHFKYERRRNHRRAASPVRPVRQDRHGDGRRSDPIRAHRRGRRLQDIQFGFGGSYEVSNPDAVTRLVGLTGITFANVFKRLRDCGYRHPADTGHHPARQVRHRHRHRSGTSTRVAHSPTIPRSSRCRSGTPRTVSSSPPNSSV
jgi:DUF35 OB-fold domain, acyl-CoA-associated